MTTEAPSPRNLSPLLKVLLPIVVIGAIIFSVLLAIRSQLPAPTDQQSVELKVGAQMPEFQLIPVGATPAQAKTLTSLGSKLYLVNFWASWCQACMIEMPSIVALRNAYKSKGFEVIAINVDEKPETVVPSIAKRLKMDFTIYSDPEQKLGDLFNVSAIPLTVILDSQRRVLMIQNGELEWDSPEVRKKIEEWLSG